MGHPGQPDDSQIRHRDHLRARGKGSTLRFRPTNLAIGLKISKKVLCRQKNALTTVRTITREGSLNRSELFFFRRGRAIRAKPSRPKKKSFALRKPRPRKSPVAKLEAVGSKVLKYTDMSKHIRAPSMWRLV